MIPALGAILCCCGCCRCRDPQEGFLAGNFLVERMTVGFSGVSQPVLGDDLGEIGPGNPASPGPEAGIPCEQPGCEEYICDDCDEWNREWEVHHVGECVWAEAQARTDQQGGYLREPRVYTTPDAGSACFPCAAVDDDTGIRVSISCNEDTCLLSAELDVTIDGCSVGVYFWEPWNPADMEVVGDNVIERRADRFSGDEIPFADLGEPCYVPDGLCNQADFSYPCIGADPAGRQWLYDRYNCRWTQLDENDQLPVLRFYTRGQLPPPTPKICDPCPPPTVADTFHIATDQWTPVPDVNGPELIDDEDARDLDAWDISEIGNYVFYQWTMEPNPGVVACPICLWIRYRNPVDPLAQAFGKVVVEAVTAGVAVNEAFALARRNDYDIDPQAEFDRFNYALLGCFYVSPGQTIQIDVVAPEDGSELVFDDIVLTYN